MQPQWPEFLLRSFDSAIVSDPAGADESVFYGPYTRVLYHLLSVEGDFEIVPQFRSQQSQESIDIVTVLVVKVARHPVFFIEVKPPASFPYDSKREEADSQMRRRFRDLRINLAIPTLYGVSAFGTRLSFYEYNKDAQTLQPALIIPTDGTILTDVAPADRWDCDMLRREGADRFKDVFARVKQMCANVAA
jgi:hypothetical protein